MMNFLVLKFIALVKTNSIEEANALGNILAHTPIIIIVVNLIYTIKCKLKRFLLIITTSVYILLLASIHLIAYRFRF